jgi:hypothetical protein
MRADRRWPQLLRGDAAGLTRGGEGEIARGRGRPLVLRFAPDRRSLAAASKNRSAIFVELTIWRRG